MSTTTSATSPTPKASSNGSQPKKLGFQVLSSRNFPSWLASQNVSLAFSTYQSGELFFIGRQPQGGISIFERKFTRCMGLWSDTQTFCLGSIYQVWRMENMLPSGELDDGFDRLYVPRVGYTTGDVVHWIRIEGNIQELYDVVALPGVKRPKALGFLTDEIRHNFGIQVNGNQQHWSTEAEATDKLASSEKN